MYVLFSCESFLFVSFITFEKLLLKSYELFAPLYTRTYQDVKKYLTYTSVIEVSRTNMRSIISIQVIESAGIS